MIYVFQIKSNQYQDSMALTARFSKPDFFVTFTCNPIHPDILNNLGNGILQGTCKLQANDRPEIVTSTFKLHTEEFYRDMQFVFGEQEAITTVIERFAAHAISIVAQK